MPGSADPVMGSRVLTAVTACAVATVVVAVPHAFRGRLTTPRRDALVGGGVYALSILGLWAAARFPTDAFASSLDGQPLLGAVLLAAQAGVPLYCYGRWRLVAPMAGLFALTAIEVYAFLHVYGETDPLALYALAFGPALVVGLSGLAALEGGSRWLLAGTSGAGEG